jgi:exopolysaccharide biosynthesis protein
MGVVRLAPQAPLDQWCAEHGVHDAVSGGYSTKPEFVPLGELWIGGRRVEHRPFAEPWDARRAALAVADGRLSIDARDRLESKPAQDLLQAGPLLVREGRSELAGKRDPEGFSATCEEFDEDITASREPRVAVALSDDELLAVAADGRAPGDAGLTLWELAELLSGLGASAALNLDGGSAGVVVAGGRRVNTPRDDEGNDMHVASPATTAIVISAR